MTWSEMLQAENGVPEKPRTARRVLIGSAVVLAVLAVLGAGTVAADIALRAYAEDQVRKDLAARLPDGVTGDLEVEIGGSSFLQQYASGSFDRVTVGSSSLTVAGVPLAATLVATGVPTDLSKPIRRLDSTIELSQSAVNDVITLPGTSGLGLGAGTVSYDGSFDLLGWSLKYAVTAAVEAAGDSVVFTPQNVTLSSGSTVFDASAALAAAKDRTVRVCVARYLPQGFGVSAIRVAPNSVSVDVTASDFVLDEDSLRTLGTCP